MKLLPLVPRRWQRERWWQPLWRSLTLAVLLPTLVLGTWYRVEAYLVARERPLEPDPKSFYELARRMHGPYESAYREPLQIGLIKVSLWLFGDRPASVLIPTLAASVGLIVVTFLFGRAVFGLPVGLAGAVLVAFNHYLIRSGAKGYRLELFALLVMTYIYVLLGAEGWRLRSRALVGGLVGGLLLLVRITSGTLVAGALVLFFWRERRRVEHRWKLVGWTAVSLAVSLAVLAPYLYQCWQVSGRVLWAIDCHAQWWAAYEVGRQYQTVPHEENTLSVFQYLMGEGRWLRTVLRSLRGYGVVLKMLPWYAGGWRFLLPFALAGTVMTLRRRERYLFWCAFWALLPFTVVMPVGGHVRFFMFLYPLYALVAVVGVYPLLFGVLYYMGGERFLKWVGADEASPAVEVRSYDEAEKPSRRD